MTMGCGTPTPAADRGFTLVEVLVALGIMATLAVMGWQGIDSIVRTRDASQARLDYTLRLGTVLAQWEQDLASLHNTDAVPALSYDGKTLRLTRRAGDGVQLVAWSLTPATGSAQTDAGSKQWIRWAGPSVSGSAALQDSWLRSQILQSNDPALLRTLDGVSQVQLYCYRGNAWSNCQSSGNVAAPAPAQGGASGVPPAVRTVLPSGLRLVLTFTATSGYDSVLTRDVAFGPQPP
ncbi:MAG: prepilin-type N-terminal cleavage/methylation domain-containing protein [Burkholderiales bacterium]